MDVFNSDPEAVDESTIASCHLQSINNGSSNTSFANTHIPTSDNSAASRAAVVNSNNRKRCFSVLISPGNIDATNACGPGSIQHSNHLQQAQHQQQIIVHPKQLTQQQRAVDPNSAAAALFHHTAVILPTPRQKIPRPPNAFMLFANEWRKKLAVQFPRESNKDISVRLGAMWKTMQKEEKEKYFTLARQVDAEHKKKYPDYVYNPKEARMRKALREQSRETRNQLARCHTAAAILPGSSARQQVAHHQQWANKAHHGFPPGLAGRQSHGRQGLLSPRMLAEQQRSLEETKKAIREQVEQGMIQGYTEAYLDIEAIPYHQLTNHMGLPGSGDYAVIAEIDGQQWLPYMQTPQPGAAYMMRANEDMKLQQGGWNQYSADTRTQVPPYPLRQQVINGSYGSCLSTQPISETSGSSQNQMVNHGDRSINGSDGSTSNIQQQQYIYQQQQSAANAALSQNMISKDEPTREERMEMLDLIPTTSAKNDTPNAITTSSITTTTNQKPETSATYTSNSQLQTPITTQNKSSKNLSATDTLTEITSALSDSSNVANGTENTNGPLPAFEQAFGSTEIGRYSHEGFFNTTQQTENQQSTNNQNPEHKSDTTGTNQSEMMSNSHEPTSVPDEYPPPGTPTLIFSPTDKVQGGETLLSPSGWHSLYFYSPGGTNINPKMAAASENAQRLNSSMSSAYTCYGSPQFPPPAYAAYFDYALLSGAEFMPGSADPEAVLVGVPSGPGFGDGNELQVALDGGGSTVLASGNTFRDTEAGLDYVTLHIPANAITNSADGALEVTSENGESIILTGDDDEIRDKNISDIAYDEINPHTQRKLRKMESYSQNISIINSNVKQMQSICNNTNTDVKENFDMDTAHDKDISENSNQKDDLERQDLTITGMAMREPIVISQTERICVLMDTPNPVSDGKEFTSL